ncbi:dTMP kinase [Dactylosporangium sp. NPDC051541]|uniref:dTMP kinase n=1 Tax=Dactylosporangium sp. NPDC051541 TaxID=3363977 RepID=UPI0037BCE466
MTGFQVVLGGDFAGKSEVLSRLPRADWHVVSYDDPNLQDFPVVRRVRGSLFFEALRHLHRPYSPELVFSLLHPVVWYLHDETVRCAREGPTVVDSYYFKLLAKGVIRGIADPATAALWRAMPQPDGVVFLDVDPDVAWQRSRGPANLNPFEHYGPQPTYAAFVAYQRDLRAAMLAEVRDLRVTVVDGAGPPDEVAARVRAVLRTVPDRVAR